MGLGSSRTSYDGGPKSFYLVIGNPPITYLRDANKGPLIYNVELPENSGPEMIEQSNVLKSYCCIHGKEGTKLQPASATNPGMAGHLLTFTVSAMQVSWTLDVFVDVKIEFKKGFGLCISSAVPGEEESEMSTNVLYHMYHAEFLGHEDVKQIPITCPQAIHIASLRSHEAKVPGGPRVSAERNAAANSSQSGGGSGNPVSPSSPGGASPGGVGTTSGGASPPSYYCPIVIRVSYISPTTGEERGTTTEYFACMGVPPLRGATSHDKENETLTLKMVKQYMQCEGDLFEINDVYGGDSSGGGSGGGMGAGDGTGEPGEGGTHEGSECVVCLTSNTDTTIMPCLHHCLCAECAQRLREMDQPCPICRCKIEKFITKGGKDKK